MILGGCVLTGGLVLSAIVPAQAADLTGIDAGIITAQHGLPGAIGSAQDDFESPGKTDLAGRTLSTGQQWSASPDFEVTGGAAQATKNNVPLSIATLPWVSIPTTRVTAQITTIGAAEFGLLLQADRDSPHRSARSEMGSALSRCRARSSLRSSASIDSCCVIKHL